MQSLPPDQSGYGLLAFLLRFTVAAVSLVALAVLITFGIVVVLVLLGVFIVAGIWVRWKAGREDMEWRQWLAARMKRRANAGARAAWQESVRAEEQARAREAGVADGQDFYTTITTIEGEYAVVEEQKAKQSAASQEQQ